jgi:HK97 family phage major capsid protein
LIVTNLRPEIKRGSKFYRSTVNNISGIRPLRPPRRSLDDEPQSALKAAGAAVNPHTTIEERRAKAEARAIAHGSAGRFKSGPEFMQALLRQQVYGEVDSRLVRAPTGAGEVDPTGGGFAVPPVFADDIEVSVYNEADVLPYVRRVETDKPNDWQFPAVDETSRADGSRSGGALAYWSAEGVAPTATWPRVRAVKFSAKKLIALVPVSNELWRDVPNLYDFLVRTLGGELAYQIDKSLIKGGGGGQLLGVLGAPGTISVPKINGQVAGSIVAENVQNMWSRLAAPCRKRALWFGNEEVDGQLSTFNTASATQMYTPQGVGGNEYSLLCGRPLLYSEACSALGTPGDLILMDPTQYLLVDGGFRSALSLDVAFDSDSAHFRLTWRGNGAPLWPAPITPANGTASRSPYVTITQR